MQAFPRGRLPLGPGFQGGDEVGHPLLELHQGDVGLAAEVEVERAGGDVGRVGYVVDGGGLVTLRPEQLGSRVDDPLAGGGLAALLPVRVALGRAGDGLDGAHVLQVWQALQK